MNHFKFLLPLCAAMIATIFGQSDVFAQEAVDLGLPSGTLWADRNVGAEDICKCGEYVAYGETSSKGNYTWDTYEYSKGNSKRKLALSKYVDEYPSVNKLDAQVDFANSQMGGNWVTPTREDFMELLDNCDIKIVRNYNNTGVRGLMVYNRSDRSKFIFIPGCGVIKESKRYNSDIGKNGLIMLWTATTNLKFNANQAYYFSADDGNGGGGRAYTNISETDYCVGMAVRGVRKKSQTEIEAEIEKRWLLEMDTKNKYGDDSVACMQHLSRVKELCKQGAWEEAYPLWSVLFNKYPRSSQTIYSDGVNIIKYKISKATYNRPWIDTLLLLYDRRIHFFAAQSKKYDEGYILGRKGLDMMKFKWTITDSYNTLQKSIELRGVNSECSVIQTAMEATVTMYNFNKINAEVAKENYQNYIKILTAIQNSGSEQSSTAAKVIETIKNKYSESNIDK